MKIYSGPTIWGSSKSSVIPEEELTGIETITSKNAASDATFNLMGQRVSSNVKGIVVKGGKKQIIK